MVATILHRYIPSRHACAEKANKNIKTIINILLLNKCILLDRISILNGIIHLKDKQPNRVHR